MKKTVEFIGKKVQDAVNEGLNTLGISLEDAEIKIIESGGLFKKARVAITYDAPDEKPEEKKEEKTAPVLEEENAKSTKKSKKTDKQTTPPEGEPHWNGAPVKSEPTTVSRSKPVAEEEAPEKGTVVSEEPAAKQEKPAQSKKNRNKKKTKSDEEGTRERTQKKARESTPPTEQQIEFTKGFMTELLAKMGIAGEAEITVDDGMRINVNTEDSRIIGHRGEVLDSIQQLVSSLINTSHGSYVHVTVDGLGYRGRRKETLEGLAGRMADKAVRTRRKVLLDVMNSADRRVVHAALSEREDVFTRSEGHEPSRRVAIIPKRNNR